MHCKSLVAGALLLAQSSTVAGTIINNDLDTISCALLLLQGMRATPPICDTSALLTI